VSHHKSPTLKPVGLVGKLLILTFVDAVDLLSASNFGDNY